MDKIPYLLTGLLLWWALSTIYWTLVRRPLLVRLSRHIDGIRIKLESDMAACQRGEGYDLVMSRLSWTLDELNEVRFSALANVDFSQVRPRDYEKFHRTIANSPTAVRFAHIKLVLAIAGAFALNAPFLVFLFSGLVLAFSWTSWCRGKVVLIGDVILGRHGGYTASQKKPQVRIA